MQSICIVTPGYISSTPRAVREADALSEAGFDVRVVATQGPLDDIRRFDAELARDRAWRLETFRWSPGVPCERWHHLRSGIRHRLAQKLPIPAFRVPGIAERAEGRVFPELLVLAAAAPADLFIGHYPTGLAAAWHAARRYQAAIGYDIEDIYSEIQPPSPTWLKSRQRVLEIESRYVRDCAQLSTAARPAAEWFARRFGTDVPLVIHNCHAWSDRARLDGRTLDRKSSALSLYWYSQTIGLDRGLQDAIEAAGLIGTPIEIHLRGTVAESDRRTLIALAERCGVAARLFFHHQVTPDALLSRAAEHDVGLALETPTALNRRLTVTNKLLLYLTAGLAVAASDLEGQRSVLETCPEAGFLYASGDARALADRLSLWTQHPEKLAEARQAALAAARERWNLETEISALVCATRTLLESRAAHVA